jgi:hypothetical protein
MTEIPARLSIVTLGVRDMDSARSTGRWAAPSCPTVTTPGPAISSGVFLLALFPLSDLTA